MLEELKVDRIEIASARVSEGELEAVKKITAWASENNQLHKIEVLTFVDGGKSIDWMIRCWCKSSEFINQRFFKSLNTST